MSTQLSVKALTSDAAVRKSFEDILGKRAPAFLSSIVSCTASNPALQRCDPMSIVRSASIAAILDLPIAPGLGFAFIVPYKGVATFQLGWKGYVQLAMRTGQYARMHATPVMKGQIKNRNPFTGDIEFCFETPSSNEVVGYLFYFKTVTGFERYHYMSYEECKAHGLRYSMSFKKDLGLWVDDFESMALKTVVKQCLSKWGILSIDMQTALTYDHAQVLDLETGAHNFPDNMVTAESSAERVEELAKERDWLPGLEPKQTAEQFYKNVIESKEGFVLLEKMIAQLEAGGHKAHAEQLLNLCRPKEEK